MGPWVTRTVYPTETVRFEGSTWVMLELQDRLEGFWLVVEPTHLKNMLVKSGSFP